MIKIITWSKTIWNKISEADELIRNYCEFQVLKSEYEYKNNFCCGVKYLIWADCYLDYALGICDAMDIKYDFDVDIDGEPEIYNLHIYLEDK